MPETDAAPQLRNPEAAEILGLQSDEGLQLQYLDLRILRPFPTGSALFVDGVYGLGCFAPAVR